MNAGSVMYDWISCDSWHVLSTANPTALPNPSDALSWATVLFVAIATASSFASRNPQNVVMKPDTLSGLTSTPLDWNISLTLSMASSGGPRFGADEPLFSSSKPWCLIQSTPPSLIHLSPPQPDGPLFPPGLRPPSTSLTSNVLPP